MLRQRQFISQAAVVVALILSGCGQTPTEVNFAIFRLVRDPGKPPGGQHQLSTLSGNPTGNNQE
jgi:hypothetical protein